MVVVANGKLDVVHFDIGAARVAAEVEHMEFGHGVFDSGRSDGLPSYYTD